MQLARLDARSLRKLQLVRPKRPVVAGRTPAGTGHRLGTVLRMHSLVCTAGSTFKMSPHTS